MSRSTGDSGSSPHGVAFRSLDGTTEPLDYKPLSMLALAGFTVAGIYTMIIVVGAFGAFLSGTPLILGGWSLLLPITAGFLSFFGWRRIQASEGTRAGAMLASWGCILSLLVGLGYWAYFAATYFAVRGDAVRFSKEWLQAIADEKLGKGYLLTVEPSARAGMDLEQADTDPKQRDNLEMRFNQNEREARGRVSMFSSNDMVRLVRQAGKEAQFDRLAVGDYDYIAGGHQFRMTYALKTPQGVFEILVHVHGSESKHKEFAGRQWYVQAEKSGVNRQAGRTLTDLGESDFRLRDSAHRFTTDWLRKLRDERRWLEGILDVSEPATRADKLAKVRQQRISATGTMLSGSLLAGIALLDAPGGYPEEYQRFVDGSLIDTEHRNFWAPINDRARILEGARKLFRHPVQLGAALSMQPMELALITRDKGHVQVAQDLALSVAGTHSVELRMILDTEDLPSREDASVTWRILRFEFVRARVQMRMGSPGGGGPPGAAPPQ